MQIKLNSLFPLLSSVIYDIHNTEIKEKYESFESMQFYDPAFILLYYYFRLLERDRNTGTEGEREREKFELCSGLIVTGSFI